MAMASPLNIIKENEHNMKQITSNLKGRTELQRELIDIINKRMREEEEEPGKAHADGAPLPIKEQLVAERSEAPKKRKRKRSDDEIECPIDADGGHQPVRIHHWSDEPGPLKDGSKVWDRRFYYLNNWGLKHFAELFGYLEPSLFGGALQPTASLKMMRQVMERCFGYNTGAVAGQRPTKLRHINVRNRRQVYDLLRKDYITNGRPLRDLRFESGQVNWEDPDNGIYQNFHVDVLPRGIQRPILADSCGFCVWNTMTNKGVCVPALSVRTFDLNIFIHLPIKFNHNETGAKYELSNGGSLEIYKFSSRQTRPVAIKSQRAHTNLHSSIPHATLAWEVQNKQVQMSEPIRLIRWVEARKNGP